MFWFNLGVGFCASCCFASLFVFVVLVILLGFVCCAGSCFVDLFWLHLILCL